MRKRASHAVSLSALQGGEGRGEVGIVKFPSFQAHYDALTPHPYLSPLGERESADLAKAVSTLAKRIAIGLAGLSVMGESTRRLRVASVQLESAPAGKDANFKKIERFV